MGYSKFIPEGYYEITAHCADHDEEMEIELVRMDELDYRMDIVAYPCPKCDSSAGKSVWVVVGVDPESTWLVGAYTNEERARREAEEAAEDYRTENAQWRRGVYYPEWPFTDRAFYVAHCRMDE